jgi:hypothetical protein
METWLQWAGVSNATMVLELHQLGIAIETSHKRLSTLRSVDRAAGDESWRQIDTVIDVLGELIDATAFALDPAPEDALPVLDEEVAA